MARPALATKRQILEATLETLKAAGFAGLLQVTFLAFPAFARDWAPAFAVLAAFTMLVGNVIALAQSNIVRLLAYSSVAQAGYMLVPFAAGASGSAAVRHEAFQAVRASR